MQIKLFTIPIENVNDFTDELNSFLNNNKIIQIEKHLVQTDTGTFWCFYINYIDKYSAKNWYEKKAKVDYKNILSETEFKTFEILRLIRKEIAKEDNVSAFVIATDAELAEISKLTKTDLSNLKKIKGFGNKKAEKYGKRLIEGLKLKPSL